MSDYSYKSKDELELLRRADMGDTEAFSSLIQGYWFGYDDDIQLDRAEARNCINRVENLANQRNRLAMGLVANHHILYNRPEGPPEDYPLFDEVLVLKCYEQILKEAKAENHKSMLAASWYELITPKTEGFKYLLRSAELGCAEAYYFLALAYERTSWAVKSPDFSVWDYGIQLHDNLDLEAEAIKWFTKGAQSNSIYSDECHYKLALMYYDASEKGLREIANNPEHLYLKYLKSAATLGHIPAETRLNTFEEVILPSINEVMGKNLDNTKNKNTKSSGCYIATAVYGSYDAPEVLVLRRFRDDSLYKKCFGRLFIQLYYKFSPPIAEKLIYARRLNSIVRIVLNRFVKRLEKTFKEEQHGQ